MRDRRLNKWEFIAVAVTMIMLGWVLGIGFAKTFWSEQTAAWVQAIGSIAAIVGAAILGNRQLAEARMLASQQIIVDRWRELERHVRLFNIAEGYADAARIEIERLSQLPQSAPGSSKQIKTLQAAISALPVHDLPAADGALALTAINAALGRYYSRRKDLAAEHQLPMGGSASRIAQLTGWIAADQVEIERAWSLLVLQRNDAIDAMNAIADQAAKGQSQPLK